MNDTFAWIGEGLGSEQIGRSVDIQGKKGVVVEGTGLTITVRWNELPRISWWKRLFGRRHASVA